MSLTINKATIDAIASRMATAFSGEQPSPENAMAATAFVLGYESPVDLVAHINRKIRFMAYVPAFSVNEMATSPGWGSFIVDEDFVQLLRRGQLACQTMGFKEVVYEAFSEWGDGGMEMRIETHGLHVTATEFRFSGLPRHSDDECLTRAFPLKTFFEFYEDGRVTELIRYTAGSLFIAPQGDLQDLFEILAESGEVDETLRPVHNLPV